MAKRAGLVAKCLGFRDQIELHRVLKECDTKVRRLRSRRHHGFELFRIDEIDTVIAAECPAFDSEPVVIGAGIAFLGIDDKGLGTIGSLPLDIR
ncbi:hypothetical protein USDA257_p05150 (plasmid) [Sinorhizobium fredii USDA 257]|uniref:Uncharacterized protein n=1 Tax=Sinorhizobium fredii (strain USDA 257) TaxID=1185652 RepID=I3XH74_SINF2|nr:hypothetical protein USDA257_p05150 [Sinorhizobium fredii USDA 257]